MAEPIIPWLGGKRRLADILIPRFPARECAEAARTLLRLCSAADMTVEPISDYLSIILMV